MEVETRNIVKNSYTDPVSGKFIQGNPGKPEGATHFNKDFFRAIKKMAKSSGETLTKEEAENMLHKIGFRRAKDGSFAFWGYIMDRLYGKEPEKLAVAQKNLDNLSDDQRKKVANIVKNAEEELKEIMITKKDEQDQDKKQI